MFDVDDLGMRRKAALSEIHRFYSKARGRNDATAGIQPTQEITMFLETSKSSAAAPISTPQTPATSRLQRASLAARESGRLQSIDSSTCEREYTDAELEFMTAIQEYKTRSRRLFPTWSEILEVAQGLGYQRVQCAEGGLQ